MKVLKLAAKGFWRTDGATVTHEKVDGHGWSYVVRWQGASANAATIWATLDEAMIDVGCDAVEVGGRQAEELARD